MSTSRTDQDEPSIFQPENLLREARRQRGIALGSVPSVCVLDPDGDMVRHLRSRGEGGLSATWACYHTEMWETIQHGVSMGIVGCAVGAPYAVLIAEQCFASGARVVVSVTSAGQLDPTLEPPCFVLIDRALRGEGTSSAYLPAASDVEADAMVLANVETSVARTGLPLLRGTSWTTDAPYRETASAISRARELGAIAVEMEAAALYAFGRARGRPVVCFAHITNQMAQTDGDFEKGPADGAIDALRLVAAAATTWRDE